MSNDGIEQNEISRIPSNNVTVTIINNSKTNSCTTVTKLVDCPNNDIHNIPHKIQSTEGHIIYRFKFTNDFMTDLYTFSKIHQYDSRQDFKETWKIWTEENDIIINEEIERLTRLGYDGDIVDKMFKSARYYFRKKSSVIKEPKQRRQYINVERDMLVSMDLHISFNIYNVSYQPKSGFISYCKDNEAILRNAINNIYNQGITDTQIIHEKIKKTYKNRYFMIISGENGKK